MTATAPSEWMAALEARHLADLRLPEVTRALRALSSAYVERRQALTRGGALDSAGKRAAFALFYAPLHYIITAHVLDHVGAGDPDTIVDLGCGTGAAGAAWSLACGRRPRVIGLDRHPWAVDEARWTYRQLTIEGRARQGDVSRFTVPRGRTGIVAAYVLNEVPEDVRVLVLERLLEAARRSARVLILEPIARAVTPWWREAQRHIVDAGGRADEWDIAVDRPPLVATLDHAAGLDHRRVKARSLFIAHSR